jgi:hypothetical protein
MEKIPISWDYKRYPMRPVGESDLARGVSQGTGMTVADRLAAASGKRGPPSISPTPTHRTPPHARSD